MDGSPRKQTTERRAGGRRPLTLDAARTRLGLVVASVGLYSFSAACWVLFGLGNEKTFAVSRASGMAAVSGDGCGRRAVHTAADTETRSCSHLLCTLAEHVSAAPRSPAAAAAGAEQPRRKPCFLLCFAWAVAGGGSGECSAASLTVKVAGVGNDRRVLAQLLKGRHGGGRAGGRLDSDGWWRQEKKRGEPCWVSGSGRHCARAGRGGCQCWCVYGKHVSAQ